MAHNTVVLSETMGRRSPTHAFQLFARTTSEVAFVIQNANLKKLVKCIFLRSRFHVFRPDSVRFFFHSIGNHNTLISRLRLEILKNQMQQELTLPTDRCGTFPFHKPVRHLERLNSLPRNVCREIPN